MTCEKTQSEGKSKESCCLFKPKDIEFAQHDPQEKGDHAIITWYRFTPLKNPEEMAEKIRTFCEKHNILGRILIGKEGINGAASSLRMNIDALKNFLRQEFVGLSFREQFFNQNVYHKLVVRVRDEILVMGEIPDMAKKAPYVTPDQLKEMYDNKEDFVIIDTRNDYEFDAGHFKDAKKLHMKTFRDLPKLVEEYKKYDDKKIVTYCTGGIRCEKATAYLAEKGVKNLYQLQGGVINYVNKFPGTYWENGLVVFDSRRVSDINTQECKNSCIHCGKKSDEVIPCNDIDLDEVEEGFECLLKNPEKQERILSITPLATIENYYPKAGVAYALVDDTLEVGQTLLCMGPTTGEHECTITELKSDDGKPLTVAKKGEGVTFPIPFKVRKHDLIVIKQFI